MKLNEALGIAEDRQGEIFNNVVNVLDESENLEEFVEKIKSKVNNQKSEKENVENYNPNELLLIGSIIHFLLEENERLGKLKEEENNKNNENEKNEELSQTSDEQTNNNKE